MIFLTRLIENRSHQIRPNPQRGANTIRVAFWRLPGLNKPCLGKPRRGIFSFTSSVTGALLIAGVSICISGCAPSASLPVDASANAPAQARSTRQANSKTANAQTGVLARWWKALTTPADRTSTPAAANRAASLPIVAVDISVIAARHPAWKLASALQGSRTQSVRFEPIEGRESSTISVSSPSFDVNFNAPANQKNRPDNNQESTSDAIASPQQFFAPETNNASDAPNGNAAQEIAADGLPQLEADAGREQRESIEEFLRLVSQRQNNWRSDYNSILQTALNEDVAAMQRTALTPVSPLLPSPEVQLEMTNLRLQLSRNIFATDQEVEAARARLSTLLNRWREILRGQQQQRLQELERIRVQQPAAAKSVGLEKIERDLSAIRDAQQVAQQAIAQEHRARVETDFGDEQARLAIVLPATGVLPNTVTSNVNWPNADILETSVPKPAQSTPLRGALTSLGVREQLVFTRTNSIRAASIGNAAAMPGAQISANAGSNAARIQNLRQLAWQESIKQIQMASRRAGWQWRTLAQARSSAQNSGIVIPNRTQEILQMIANSS